MVSTVGLEYALEFRLLSVGDLHFPLFQSRAFKHFSVGVRTIIAVLPVQKGN